MVLVVYAVFKEKKVKSNFKKMRKKEGRKETIRVFSLHT